MDGWLCCVKTAARWAAQLNLRFDQPGGAKHGNKAHNGKTRCKFRAGTSHHTAGNALVQQALLATLPYATCLRYSVARMVGQTATTSAESPSRTLLNDFFMLGGHRM